MSDNTGSFHNAGIVVLLDEYSASSSEVFAGAIQDNDRGLIMADVHSEKDSFSVRLSSLTAVPCR